MKRLSLLLLLLLAWPVVAVSCSLPDLPVLADGDAEISDAGAEGAISAANQAESGPVESGVEASADAEAGGVLDASAPDCSAPTTLECNGTCVDPTLPAHCGSCGNACVGPKAGAGTAFCASGFCGVSCEVDSSTPLACAGACVDPTQPANCGACGNSCAGPPSTQGQAVCSLDGGGLPLDAGGDGGPCGITCNATYHARGADCLPDADDGGSGTADASGALGVCPSGLTDKVTTCTPGSSPSCAKGCGPELPVGSTQTNLGNKECDCSTSGVYLCQACIYESPLPGCYQPAASPPSCAAGVVDTVQCTTPCSGTGTGNDVCTLMTDAGKLDGCVCIQGPTAPIWTCQTSWF
jgi:hypothetical protein